MLITSLIFACSPMQQANRMAGKDEIKAIYPSVAFDSISARNAIAYGNVNIEGVAFTKPKTQFGYKAPLAKRIYANNVTVVLFPVTPYFEEWYRLRNEKESKKVHVYMSNDAFKYRITAQTDAYGRFKFEKMKPGRYFIQCIMGWNESRSRDVYTGSSYGSYGTSADHYSRQYYAVSKFDRLEEFITVKPNQSVMEVVLK